MAQFTAQGGTISWRWDFDQALTTAVRSAYAGLPVIEV
jgi:hypothetical protein